MAQEKMTERIVTVVITLVVTGVIGVIGSVLVGGALIRELGGVEETEPALAQRVANLEFTTNEVVTKEVVANIVDTKIGKAMATLTDRVGALETVTIPRGVVIAFDRDDLTADKCPLGWQPFKEARARVIVGAGDPSKAPGKYGYDEDARPLTHYVRGQHKGEEKVTLKVKEMPTHRHSLSATNHQTGNESHQEALLGASGAASGIDPNFNRGSRAARKTFKIFGNITEEVGGSLPHNNMPPYIALYFCKND